MAWAVVEAEDCWRWILRDLALLVLERLTTFSDFVSFSSVCKPWHSIALDDELNDDTTLTTTALTTLAHRRRLMTLAKTCRNQLPLLLVTTKCNSQLKYSLYNVSTQQGASVIYDNIRLPLPYPRRFCGSSHGWIFTIDKSSAITLLNPFSNASISLPKIANDFQDFVDDNYEYFIQRGALSKDPSLNDHYVVAVIFGDMHCLALYKSGSSNWTFVGHPENPSFAFQDLIFDRDKLLAVSWTKLVCVDLTSNTCSYTSRSIPYQRTSDMGSLAYLYLVKSQHWGGDVLVVQGYKDCQRFLTSGFRIFRSSGCSNKLPTWTKVDSIGDEAVFVGSNHSVCVSTTNFRGCRPNSIYFVEDYYASKFEPGTDDDHCGVYNLQDGSLASFYAPEGQPTSFLPATWIVPDFNNI